MKRIRNYVSLAVIAMMGFTFFLANNVSATEISNQEVSSEQGVIRKREADIKLVSSNANSLTITWPGNTRNADHYDVTYINRTTNEWVHKNVKDTTTTLEGLDYNTNYAIQIEVRDSSNCTVGFYGGAEYLTSAPDFLVVTADSLYLEENDTFKNAVNTYLDDLNKDGLNPGVVRISATKEEKSIKKCDTKEKLKAIISNAYDKGCKGFVLIGSAPDIPTAYWKYTEEDTDYSPCDLYYADMNQNWIDRDNDGVFESYASSSKADKSMNYTPELYYGRINPNGFVTGQENISNATTAYLTKLHKYRNNEKLLPDEIANRALSFRDSNDFRRSKPPVDSLSKYFKEVKGDYDENQTSPENLKAELEKGYGFTHITIHSAPGYHQIQTNGGSQKITYNNFYLDQAWKNIVNSTDSNAVNNYVKDINVKGYYLDLNGCSGCRFENANRQPISNLGEFYLFGNDYMMNVTGYTAPWGLWLDSNYYENLFGGKTVGESLKQYLNDHLDEGSCKAVLLGDPTIKYSEHVKKLDTPTPYLTNNLAGEGNETNKTVTEGKAALLGKTDSTENVYYDVNGLTDDKLIRYDNKLYLKAALSDSGKLITITSYNKDSSGNAKNKYTESFRLTVKANTTASNETLYEAESTDNYGGGYREDSSFCSGGREVTWVGGSEYTNLTFDAIYAEEDGDYKIQIKYVSGVNRGGFVTVNGANKQDFIFTNNTWSAVGTKELTVHLNKGINTITIGSTNENCTANIDALVVKKQTNNLES